MPAKYTLARAPRSILASGLLLTACAVPQPAQPRPGPIPPGAARIWFYRDYEPSVTMNDANVDLNGARVLTLPAFGPALYRDVAPGSYLIAAESVGVDTNQTKAVNLGAGQEVFAKIVDNADWVSGDDVSEKHRDTYYIKLIPPDVARRQMSAYR